MSSSTSPASRACGRRGARTSTTTSGRTSRSPSGCSKRSRPDRVRKLVYASSSSVYGDAECYPTPESIRPAPVSPYGVTKLAAEHLCELYRVNFGIPTVSLRLFTVYGPRQRPDMAFSRLVDAAVRHARSSSTATAARPATSPSWPTS